MYSATARKLVQDSLLLHLHLVLIVHLELVFDLLQEVRMKCRLSDYLTVSCVFVLQVAFQSRRHFALLSREVSHPSRFIRCAEVLKQVEDQLIEVEVRKSLVVVKWYAEILHNI